MGHHAVARHCFGVILERHEARRIHEALVSALLAAGASHGEIHEDGQDEDVYSEVFAPLLEERLGSAWREAKMMGLRAMGSAQETEWFAESQCNREIEDYAVGFESWERGDADATARLLNRWRESFGTLMSETPQWHVVAQID